MLSKFAVPSLLLVASVNGAVLPQKRSSHLQNRQIDLGNILGGAESAIDGLLQALPTDISGPIESLVDGLLNPTPTDGGLAGLGALFTAAPTPPAGGVLAPPALAPPAAAGGAFTPPTDLSPTPSADTDGAFPTDIFGGGDFGGGDNSTFPFGGDDTTDSSATPTDGGADGADASAITPTLFDPSNPAAVVLPGTPLTYSPVAGIAPAASTDAPTFKRDIDIGAILSVVAGVLPTNIASDAASIIDQFVPGALPTPAPSPAAAPNSLDPDNLAASASDSSAASSTTGSATSSATSSTATATQSNSARGLSIGGGVSLTGPLIAVACAFLGAFVAL